VTWLDAYENYSGVSMEIKSLATVAMIESVIYDFCPLVLASPIMACKMAGSSTRTLENLARSVVRVLGFQDVPAVSLFRV